MRCVRCFEGQATHKIEDNNVIYPICSECMYEITTYERAKAEESKDE